MDAEQLKAQFDSIIQLMKDNTLKERSFWDGKLSEWKEELNRRQEATDERVVALEKTFSRTFDPTEVQHSSPHSEDGAAGAAVTQQLPANQVDGGRQKQKELPEPRMVFQPSEVFETPHRTVDEIANQPKRTKASQLYGGSQPRFLNFSVLQPFDGQNSWVDYERQFCITATFYGWDEEEKAYALAMQLRGEALTVLSALPSGKPVSFEALTKLLRQRFSLDTHTSFSLLRNRVQKPKETLAEFAVQLQRLSVAAFPGCAEKVVGEIVLSQFVDGIRDEQVQNFVAIGRPQSLQDALGIALDVTTRLERRGHKHVFMTIPDQSKRDDQKQTANENPKDIRFSYTYSEN
ncbi:uncharacterized protein LOC129919045 [Episyrphus balteatus]|uniref:uncharacterized protein LOC129919045 n=1 Tax=Episyrphus balteatus TaxID=286459 RepID=UPI002485FD12|nr:uncharacterized protein LOC129919045 [Episyrphus balteatus]